MQATLEGMDLGPLLGLYLQTFVVQVTMLALSAIIFVIVYGRMVEIYLMVSLAPIPFATFGNHEQKPHRSKLSTLPVCTGIPRVSYHDLCRHLRSSNSEPVLFG